MKKLVKEILENRIIDNSKINKYVKDSKKVKTNSDKIFFLKEYAKKASYPGLYIHDEFLTCSSTTKEYSQFIIWLIKKDPYMLDASSLTGIYEKNSKLGEFLFVELSKSKEIDVAYALGTMLGGLGIKKPEKLYELVLKKTFPNNPEIILINSIWQTSYYHKIPKKIILKILEYTKSKNETIKFYAISILMDRFNRNSLVKKKILQFAKSDNKTKRFISQRTTFMHRTNKVLAIKLLKECIKTKDEQLKKEIISSLGFISKEYPIDCLIMMKDSIKKSNSAVLGQMTSYAMEQIGKSKNTEKIEKFLFNWIKTEKSGTILQFTLPSILLEIYNNRSEGLLKLLKKLNYKEKNKSRLIAKTFETFLSQAGSQAKTPSFLSGSKKILLKIAKRQNIDTGIDDRLNDPHMKVLAIVENINLHKKKKNLSTAKRNLKDFPDIVSFFGKSKILALIEKNPNHPLVNLLHRADVSETTIKKYDKAIGKQSDPMSKNMIFHSFLNQFHPQSILKDLDIALGMIGNVKSKEIRSMLLNVHQFNSAIIQAIMFSRLKTKYPVELDPQVGNNKLDLLTNMDNQDYYFEIYTPEENKKLRYLNTVQSIDTEHTKTKISQKLKGQIKAADSLNQPLIVVIDNQNIAIDEYDIINAMFGTYQWTMLWDKKTGKEVKSYATRKDDSFGRKLEYGKAISAILIVRREVDHRDMKVKLVGKTIPNPYAKIPLDRKTIKKIENVLLGTSIN